MALKQTTSCLGYQQITDASSAVGLTVPTGANFAMIVCEAQAVRWRDDGVNPTTTVGMPLAVGVDFSYDGDFNRIKFIAAVAGAIINISYYA
ncbi:MAG: hypothetical protein PHR19_02310 [Bacteroidales bacterium]|nr:hypothetical protein [Bacteroidales bacterium]